MNLAYGLFMAEAEGQLPGKRTKFLDECIKDFQTLAKRGYDPTDYVNQVLKLHNISPSSLTSKEVEYLYDAIRKI